MPEVFTDGFFLYATPPHPHTHTVSYTQRVAQSTGGMKESSDRHSCELQPLFQEEGLETRTEPPQRPPTDPSLCSHRAGSKGLLHVPTDVRKTLSAAPLWRRKVAVRLPNAPCVRRPQEEDVESRERP